MFELKKGMSLGSLPYAVLMLVFVGIMAGVGLKVNDQMIAQYTAAEIASNTTGHGVNATITALGQASTGITQIPTNMTLLGTIIALSAVITILWSSFGGMMGGRGSATV